MLKKLVSGAIFGLLAASGPGITFSVLVGSALMAGVSTAEAQLRVGTAKYRPPYGHPFPELDFFGEIKVTDGGCNLPGNVNNVTCGGSLSFVSATLNFGPVQYVSPGVPDLVNEPPAWQTINFTRDPLNPLSSGFGQVLSIDRTSPNASSWAGVTSSAFAAVRGTIGNPPNPNNRPPLTVYDPDGGGPLTGSQAWFSLVLVGGSAQVLWFEKDPGLPPLTALNVPRPSGSGFSSQYAECYFFADRAPPGSVITLLGNRNRCGLSSFDLGEGAPFLKPGGGLGFAVTVVPEPEAYAMGLAGLAVIGFMTLLSRRRSVKS